ncbi:hypothetical protein EIP91_004679 [Steccherinum ochraceum]|uniref:SnoaL-like domain-containing protein n=1 Tax=Steccherinum ochraceum TaxID=92696 RepID=A0A4R0R8F3_9APHY|nr:hypothetical protein EIP91_004679 [Steccherinum ochraceum]
MAGGIVQNDVIKNPSPQLQAFLRWTDAMTVKRDPVALADSVTDDLAYQTLPASMGFPPRDKAGFLQFSSLTFMAMLEDFWSEIHEVVETADTIAVHASGKATSITGAPYANEYTVIAHVAKQANGEYKISAMKEFLDSKVLLEFMAAEKQRQEERAKAAA